jgi:hypothetical protein
MGSKSIVRYEFAVGAKVVTPVRAVEIVSPVALVLLT